MGRWPLTVLSKGNCLPLRKMCFPEKSTNRRAPLGAHHRSGWTPELCRYWEMLLEGAFNVQRWIHQVWQLIRSNIGFPLSYHWQGVSCGPVQLNQTHTSQAGQMCLPSPVSLVPVWNEAEESLPCIHPASHSLLLITWQQGALGSTYPAFINKYLLCRWLSPIDLR